MVKLLKVVVPAIVPSALSITTVPVPALNVPLFNQVPAPPLMAGPPVSVNVPLPPFTTPPALISIVPTVTVPLIVGSFGVVAASGTTILALLAGTTPAFQFDGIFQLPPLTAPNQVVSTDTLFDIIQYLVNAGSFSAAKYNMPWLLNSTQF